MAIETNLTMAHASNTESEPEELPDDASDTSSDTSYEVEELQSSEFPGYFEERNGRLFHSHGNSPYPLPVDAPEQNVGNVILLPSLGSNFATSSLVTPHLWCADIIWFPPEQRAKVQHFFLKALLHGNYVGPVQDVLRPTLGERRKVLDLATGTGNWYVALLKLFASFSFKLRVLDMAQEFPHAKFYGLDIGTPSSHTVSILVLSPYYVLVPIATRMPPNNVRFEMQDIGAQLRFHDGTFDLVHARAVSMTVSYAR